MLQANAETRQSLKSDAGKPCAGGKLGLTQNLSGATIFVNAATTLSFFGEEEKGLELYGKAAAIYEKEGRTETYEYAALLNNEAGTLYALKKYDEAEAMRESAKEIYYG